jgi:hypothetical protein
MNMVIVLGVPYKVGEFFIWQGDYQLSKALVG